MSDAYIAAVVQDADPLELVTCYLNEFHPGGEYIAPHLNQGPWYGLLLNDDVLAGRGSRLSKHALAAWPGQPFAHWAGWSKTPDISNLHVVPKFIFQLLCQDFDDDGNGDNFRADHLILGPFENKPTAADIIRNLGSVYDIGPFDDGVLDDLAQQFTDLGTFHAHLMAPLHGLRAPLSELGEHIHTAFAALRDALTPP